MKRSNLPALRRLVQDQPSGIRTHGKLVRAVPVARSRNHVRHPLKAAPALAQVLKIVSARPIDEKNIGLRALRRVLQHATVASNAQLKQRFVKPQLIFR